MSQRSSSPRAAVFTIVKVVGLALLFGQVGVPEQSEASTVYEYRDVCPINIFSSTANVCDFAPQLSGNICFEQGSSGYVCYCRTGYAYDRVAWCPNIVTSAL